jgi:hypothetical protein
MDADLRNEPPEPPNLTTDVAGSDLAPQWLPPEEDHLSWVGYESAHPWHRSSTDMVGHVPAAA